MNQKLKSKKDAIADLEYAMSHLSHYPSKSESLAQRDNLYNVLMFYFAISKKRLDSLIKVDK
jgi:hypothetical protein